MGKRSQLDKVIANIDRDIADLQAMKARLVQQQAAVKPRTARKKKPGDTVVAAPAQG